MKRLLPVIILAAACACGGPPPQAEQPAAGQTPTPAVETTTASAAAQPTPVSLPLQPLQLAETRYLDEMVAEETDKAYAGTGEFIDPARVARLLHAGRTQPAAPPAGSRPAQQQQQQQQPAPTTWRISGIVHEEAKKLFAAGKIAEAARKWRSLPTDTRAWTVSVEVHCSVDELKNSWQKIITLEPPCFVLPENVKGRNCYRLCLGVFTRQADADVWLKQVGERLPGSYPFSLTITRQ